jgi:hypothetical protein
MIKLNDKLGKMWKKRSWPCLECCSGFSIGTGGIPWNSTQDNRSSSSYFNPGFSEYKAGTLAMTAPFVEISYQNIGKHL